MYRIWDFTVKFLVIMTQKRQMCLQTRHLMSRHVRCLIRSFYACPEGQVKVDTRKKSKLLFFRHNRDARFKLNITIVSLSWDFRHLTVKLTEIWFWVFKLVLLLLIASAGILSETELVMQSSQFSHIKNYQIKTVTAVILLL